MNRYNLVEEFKKALTERFSYSDISFLYQRLFFDFLIDEKDLNNVLLKYQSVFIEDPYDWFRQFHKSVRQTDFFDGYYQKVVNMLTDTESKRYREILRLRSDWRNSDNHGEAPFTDELAKLNRIMNTVEPVSVTGIADSFLYGLINLDENDMLKTSMEVAFKICT